MTYTETITDLIKPNPYIPTSFKWYEFELYRKYPLLRDKPVRKSRGYKFIIGTMLVDCKDDNTNNWSIIK